MEENCAVREGDNETDLFGVRETGVGFRADFGTAGVIGEGDGDAVTVEAGRVAAVGEGFAQIKTQTSWSLFFGVGFLDKETDLFGVP